MTKSGKRAMRLSLIQHFRVECHDVDIEACQLEQLSSTDCSVPVTDPLDRQHGVHMPNGESIDAVSPVRNTV